MSGRRRSKPRRGPKRVRGMITLLCWLIVLLGALSLVTWRQPRGIEMERALRSLEAERAIAQAERIESLRRIEELRSRARIVQVAEDRLGMHVPDDSEIVFLPRAEAVGPGGEGDRPGNAGTAAARTGEGVRVDGIRSARFDVLPGEGSADALPGQGGAEVSAIGGGVERLVGRLGGDR